MEAVSSPQLRERRRIAGHHIPEGGVPTVTAVTTRNAALVWGHTNLEMTSENVSLIY
jgi:hypothetical protein